MGRRFRHQNQGEAREQDQTHCPLCRGRPAQPGDRHGCWGDRTRGQLALRHEEGVPRAEKTTGAEHFQFPTSLPSLWPGTSPPAFLQDAAREVSSPPAAPPPAFFDPLTERGSPRSHGRDPTVEHLHRASAREVNYSSLGGARGLSA